MTSRCCLRNTQEIPLRSTHGGRKFVVMETRNHALTMYAGDLEGAYNSSGEQKKVDLWSLAVAERAAVETDRKRGE